MNIKYFGHSMPLKVLPESLKQRDPIVLNATKKRERYLLKIFSSITQVDKVSFISTGYGKKKCANKSIRIIEDRIDYIILGYFGKKILKYLTSHFYAFIWIIINVKKHDTIITYNFHPIYAIPLLLKKFFVKFRLIVEFEDFFNKDDKRSNFYGPFEKLGIRKADAFIASSCGMAKFIRSFRKDAKLIINSGYYESETQIINLPDLQKKRLTIVYSGTLDKERGVVNLINHFKSNENDKFKLVISGRGPLEEFVKVASETDERIIFVGMLNDHDFNKLISQADICINPQWSSISVNFPSKITLYLAFGKVVLSTKIDSIVKSPFSEILLFYDEYDPQSFWDQILLIDKKWIELEKEKISRITIFKQIIEEQKSDLVALILQ